MRIIAQFKSDLAAAKKIRLPWWVILCGIPISAAAAYMFDRWGRLDLFLPSFNSIGMLGFVINLKWRMRKRVWFWLAMAVIAAAHVALVLSVSWTTAWVSAVAIAGIDTIDVCAILTILAIAENCTE
jgi:hypothetical protein